MLNAIASQNGVERRHEFIGDRAAQAAIRQLDDIVFRAGIVAAALEDFAIDANVAELVDDHRKPAALRVGNHVADQRRFAGAEESGDDGAGDARKRSGHSSTSSKPMGGTRATRPRLRGVGRPRHGRIPSAARASMRAPSIRASALVASSPPKT